MTRFEDRLWSGLIDHHADQMRAAPHATAALAASASESAGKPRGTRRPHALRRGRPALLTGTALGSAAVAGVAALALGVASSPPAFAVADNADGSVTVTLNEISGISGVNAQLAQDGIRAKAVPLTATCPTRSFLVQMPADTNPDAYTITIVPAQIPAGYTAVVAVTQTASGQVRLAQAAFPGSAPPCINSESLSTGNTGPQPSSAAVAKSKAAIAKIKASQATSAESKH